MDLPNRDRGAVSDTGEGLGRLKLALGHLEVVERLHGQDVEPCPAVDEGPGDLHVADDWGAKHREDSGCGRTLDGARRPPEGARGFELGEDSIHFAGKLLEDAFRGWGLSSAQDASDRARLLEAPTPSS